MRHLLLMITLLVAARAELASADSMRPEPYVQALQVANSFLSSWVQRDSVRGLSFMSIALLKSPRDSTGDNYASWLRFYMSGLSNPHHQAFEIRAGRAAAAERFSFPVTLYELVTGEGSADAYSSSIELVHEAAGWRVSRLPRSSDNQ